MTLYTILIAHAGAAVSGQIEFAMICGVLFAAVFGYGFGYLHGQRQARLR